MKKIALFTVLSLLFASPVFAAVPSPDAPDGGSSDVDCTTQPACADLGYTTNADCEDGTLLYCPYDASYKKCIPNATTATIIDCEGLGFTTENKNEWCAKLIKCPADSSYTLCAKNITCAEGEALIGSECKKIYASCAEADLLSFSQCNTAGYTCGALKTIYTSADGSTTACYLGKTAKACPAGYTTDLGASCNRTPDGGTCSDGYITLFDTTPDYYSGDTACNACSCKPTLDLKPSTGCNCTADKPYWVNNQCSATCPAPNGQQCLMCAIYQEYVDIPTHGGGSND